MTLDALDPGPDGTFPNVALTPDGYLDTSHHPIQPYLQGGVPIDPVPTVTLPNGRRVKLTEVVPPPPEQGAQP